MSLNNERKVYIYNQFLATFQNHKLFPKLRLKSKRIMNEALAGEKDSFGVGSLTHACLERFAELNFSDKTKDGTKLGIVRAHLIDRSKTMDDLLDRDEPVSFDEFWRIWLKNDKTALCLKEENKRISSLPRIEFDNEDRELFQSTQSKWRHRKQERDLLRSLMEKKTNDQALSPRDGRRECHQGGQVLRQAAYCSRPLPQGTGRDRRRSPHRCLH